MFLNEFICRTVIEVADFNFGETQSLDMESKTFRERLLDGIREAIDARRTPPSSELTGETGVGYGSMK